MSGQDTEARSLLCSLSHVGFTLLGVGGLLVIAIVLEKNIGIGFDTSFRVACTAGCLVFIAKLGRDYPGESWTRVGLWLALLVNVGIFFTPLVDRPTSRGELMLFALPDAVILLTARIATYPATDVHRGAMRQQMFLGLFVAVTACAILYAWILVGPESAR